MAFDGTIPSLWDVLAGALCWAESSKLIGGESSAHLRVLSNSNIVSLVFAYHGAGEHGSMAQLGYLECP